MHRLLLFIVTFGALSLAACASEEQIIERAIEQANHCETKEDCTYVGSVCPFGCTIYVHRDEAERIQPMIENFQSDCVYDCARTYGVECVEEQCEPVLDPPPEGTVGQACVMDEECATPMEYLVQSRCPFGSGCIDGVCRVVCSIPQNELSDMWESMQCITDDDCDCSSYLADDLKECRCHSGQCVAVVGE